MQLLNYCHVIAIYSVYHNKECILLISTNYFLVEKMNGEMEGKFRLWEDLYENGGIRLQEEINDSLPIFRTNVCEVCDGVVCNCGNEIGCCRCRVA